MCLRADISCIRWAVGKWGFPAPSFFSLNWFSNETVHQLSISDATMVLLTGKIGKAVKFETLFVHIIDEIPAIFFQTWSLEHNQNSRMIIAFVRSECAVQIAWRYEYFRSSRYITIFSIILMIPWSYHFATSKSALPLIIKSQTSKATLLHSTVLYDSKVQQRYTLQNVIQKALSLEGRGQERRIFILWPMGWADYFSNKLLFEHCDVVKVNATENPQTKGILLIF